MYGSYRLSEVTLEIARDDDIEPLVVIQITYGYAATDGPLELISRSECFVSIININSCNRSIAWDSHSWVWVS